MSAISGTYSIEQVAEKYLPKNSRSVSSPSDQITSFADVLRGKFPEWGGVPAAEDLKFSKHAAKRLDEREISLSAEQNDRLSEGVQKAGAKGINDSLVIVDSLAFIVNIPNKTVITAMDRDDAMDRDVFTNIDGAVFA